MTWLPWSSVVFPGTSGFSGSPMNMLKEPSSTAAASPLSAVGPQAVSSSAAAIPATASALVRLLDVTCHASLSHRGAGDDQVLPAPSRGGPRCLSAPAPPPGGPEPARRPAGRRESSAGG